MPRVIDQRTRWWVWDLNSHLSEVRSCLLVSTPLRPGRASPGIGGDTWNGWSSRGVQHCPRGRNGGQPLFPVCSPVPMAPCCSREAVRAVGEALGMTTFSCPGGERNTKSPRATHTSVNNTGGILCILVTTSKTWVVVFCPLLLGKSKMFLAIKTMESSHRNGRIRLLLALWMYFFLTAYGLGLSIYEIKWFFGGSGNLLLYFSVGCWAL